MKNIHISEDGDDNRETSVESQEEVGVTNPYSANQTVVKNRSEKKNFNHFSHTRWKKFRAFPPQDFEKKEK